MIAEELINQMIPMLRPEDPISKALTLMEELRCGHLPVVDNGKFLGFISEEGISKTDNQEKSVSNFELIGENCRVSTDAHFYEVVRVAGENKMQMVAVESNLRMYAGAITVSDIMTTFSQTAAIQMTGSVLVLAIDLMDYSLAEIARLVEENNAKILSSTLIQDPGSPGQPRLTIKINQTDLSRIVSTLERFGYRIVGRYQEIRITNTEKERFDSLMRYLNI